MSALFTPYRTTGVVVGASAEQLCLQSLGTSTFLTAPSGRGFAVFDVAKLSLALVSRELARDVTHVAARREATFAATAEEEDGIAVFVRARRMRRQRRRRPQVREQRLEGV